MKRERGGLQGVASRAVASVVSVVAVASAVSCPQGTTGTSSGETADVTTSEVTTGAGDPTATTDTTDVDGTQGSTTGCGLLCAFDQGDGDGACDPFLQDCPAGEKCAASSPEAGSPWILNQCVPVVPNPDAVGEPCHADDHGYSGIDTCEAEAMCWGVDVDTDQGVCVALCKGSERQCTRDPASCCPAGMECMIGANAALILCLPG